MKTQSLLVNGALHAAIAGADSFPALARIAIKHHLEVHGGIIHFASGPVSTGGAGNKEENLHRLAHASRKLTEMYGFVMFDHPIWEDRIKVLAARWEAKPGNSGYCWPIMKDFYRRLFNQKALKVQGLWLLPEWGTSTGARDEKEVCVKNNIPINYLAPSIFSDLPPLPTVNV